MASDTPTPSSQDPLLTMRGIGKTFGPVRVLEGIDLDLRPGEVHVLAGENGAGKSTLMKILCGVYPEYEGEVALADTRVRFRSPSDANRQGISMIHQEMSLINPMTVADNIFLGRELTAGGAWMNHAAQRRRARALLDQIGLEVSLSRPVGDYPVSVQQMIEIAKALAFESRIIIMDEPTSALNDPEVERLFEIIADLKARGCGIIYITHKMEEIYRLADRITVLRDGQYVGTNDVADLPQEELVKKMVGRDISTQFPERQPHSGEERLRLDDFCVADPTGLRPWSVEGMTFNVHAGEILGIGGLEGSGNSDLLSGLFGAFGKNTQGEVFMDGEPFGVRSPGASIRRGMALLTKDRKGNGLVLGMSITHNTTLASLERVSPGGWLRTRRETTAAERQRETLGIRLASLGQEAGELSGGNQQKVVLGKWLETQPRVLLLDEPTRGVDVGAKHEIYELMNQWTDAGISILLITSEMPELLAMSDRIIVMHRGRRAAEFTRETATQEKILHAAMGETEA